MTQSLFADLSSEAIARFVLGWLLGRAAFDEWWGAIDSETQQEILTDLATALDKWRAE